MQIKIIAFFLFLNDVFGQSTQLNMANEIQIADNMFQDAKTYIYESVSEKNKLESLTRIYRRIGGDGVIDQRLETIKSSQNINTKESDVYISNSQGQWMLSKKKALLLNFQKNIEKVIAKNITDQGITIKDIEGAQFESNDGYFKGIFCKIITKRESSKSVENKKQAISKMMLECFSKKINVDTIPVPSVSVKGGRKVRRGAR